jgi:hypothetical protein
VLIVFLTIVLTIFFPGCVGARGREGLRVAFPPRRQS